MVVALDAADPDLVRQLAAEGEMPAMARLLEEAALVETEAPPGVFVSANWPTIFTATSPDRHGYLCWEEIRGGTYEHRQTSPSEIRGTPIWERLSEAGRRVAVLDVPHSLARPLNGAMLVEWGGHDRHGATDSWPPELAAELSARHGAHCGTAEPGVAQVAPCDYAHRAGRERTHDETAAFFDEILEGVERKRRASLDLLDRGDWDLFFSVLGESHCIGHQLWHLHDPCHYRHDPELTAKLGGDPVREVYRRLDRVVAEHLERLTPDATAYVLLAHGMTAHHDGTHLLDQVLHRLDWGLDEPEGLGLGTRAAADLARFIPRAVRGRALRAAAPLIRARAGAGSPTPLPALQDRRWFLTPNNTVEGAVRLNLAGREPAGRVHPADRREALEWLAERLKELVNLDTGGRVVANCVVADDVYRRTPGDAFGDLFVEWDRSAPIERVWSPSAGTVAVPYENWRQGDHVREGLLLATGPGIEPGRRRGVRDTADLGATFSAALGLPLPDVDGRPIASVLPAPMRTRVRGEYSRERVAGAIARGLQRRLPGWATRQDLALNSPRGEAAALSAQARAEMAELRAKVGELERHSEIAAMSAWLPQAEVSEELVISVVMPTRNRRALLERAIGSVKAQAYPRWELLVVDDGSEDDTPELLRSIEDARVRRLSTPGLGACAARNLGLNAAHGDVIAYLDDDNRFDEHWLKAVAMTFKARPEARVIYGARVYDDSGRVLRGVSSGRPGFHFTRWDPAAVQNYNLVDMNVLAHRQSPMRFDEELAYLGDWDLLLRLASDTEPLEVPAIATYYRTDADDRLSTSLADQMVREYDHVRKKMTA
jgi:predicted AlkP superfamily phosphohydrolase/phosphomutase